MNANATQSAVMAAALVEQLRALTPEQRLDILEEVDRVYCGSCGWTHAESTADGTGRCQC